MGKKLIIFTDIGDTIIDEGTEVRKVPQGVVYAAECIPGARETMLSIHREGYTVAMVADGLSESFHNTMKSHGLEDIFSAWIISEEVGVEKPNREMFQTAMERLGLTEQDKDRIIMVGNNLSRDVLGANRFGLRSVFLNWSPRYPHCPGCAEETPTFEIHRPEELYSLVQKLEAQLQEVG